MADVAEVGVAKVEVGVGDLWKGRGRRGLVRVRRLQSASLRPATCMVDDDDDDEEGNDDDDEVVEEEEEEEEEDDDDEDNDEAVLEKADDILVVMVLVALGVPATLLLPLPLFSEYLSSLLLFFLFGLSLSFLEGLDALMGR